MTSIPVWNYPPAALKIYNTYRMRAFGYRLGKNGIVCVSTVGCLGDKHDENRFTESSEVMIETLNPRHILMYGKRGRNFFDKNIESGTPVTFYDTPKTHKVTFNANFLSRLN